VEESRRLIFTCQRAEGKAVKVVFARACDNLCAHETHEKAGLGRGNLYKQLKACASVDSIAAMLGDLTGNVGASSAQASTGASVQPLHTSSYRVQLRRCFYLGGR
jgi:hypothetical protein